MCTATQRISLSRHRVVIYCYCGRQELLPVMVLIAVELKELLTEDTGAWLVGCAGGMWGVVHYVERFVQHPSLNNQQTKKNHAGYNRFYVLISCSAWAALTHSPSCFSLPPSPGSWPAERHLWPTSSLSLWTPTHKDRGAERVWHAPLTRPSPQTPLQLHPCPRKPVSSFDILHTGR